MPGEFTLYDRLTGGQTIEYFANLRGGVDPTYQASLIERLGVDPSRKFKEYSKGNKQKIGLVIALQHRPDLLVLDEPTSGLDPLVQQAFYALVREAQARAERCSCRATSCPRSRRTCDRVAIIREGRLVKVDRTEACATSPITRWSCASPDGCLPADSRRCPGSPRWWSRTTCCGCGVRSHHAVVQAAARHELVDFVSREPRSRRPSSPSTAGHG